MYFDLRMINLYFLQFYPTFIFYKGFLHYHRHIWYKALVKCQKGINKIYPVEIPAAISFTMNNVYE